MSFLGGSNQGRSQSRFESGEDSRAPDLRVPDRRAPGGMTGRRLTEDELSRGWSPPGAGLRANSGPEWEDWAYPDASPAPGSRQDASALIPARNNGLDAGFHSGLHSGLDSSLASASLHRSRPGARAASGNALSRLFLNCANPACGTGWLHLMRSRSGPVFEGGWSCSAACTAVRLEAAVAREMGGRTIDIPNHRHRVPLGLVMLEQGWITSDQLRGALDAQRSSGSGKLGNWLMRQQGVDEQLVTRALSLQWSCPVIPLVYHDAEGLAPLLPRLFIDAFGALPLRVAAGRILYLGFEDRLDPVIALAAEQMLGLRVETGLVVASSFGEAHGRMLTATFPKTELLEAISEPVLAKVLARTIERVKPVESRLVRVHDCLWLRMWTRPQTGPVAEVTGVEDVVCSLAPN